MSSAMFITSQNLPSAGVLCTFILFTKYYYNDQMKEDEMGRAVACM
jgi:hypothetical protein